MRHSLLVVTTLLALRVATARADDAAPRVDAAPHDLVGRPLVLGRGELEAALVFDVNLQPGLVWHSTSIAPDVWLGVTPELTVGLVHSLTSLDRFEPGATFCVVHQGDTLGCNATYHGSGVDVRYSALRGEIAVAPRVRVLIRELDPVKPAATLGALVRWTRGRFAITADPYLQLGLANTDLGNRHELFVPVAFAVQPLARWELVLHTGWNTVLGTYVDLDDERRLITDQWHVPVAIGTRVAPTPALELGALLGFRQLLGPQNTAKERALFVTAAWRTTVL